MGDGAARLNLQQFLSEHKFSRFQIGLYFMLLIIQLFDGVAAAIAGLSKNYISADWESTTGAAPNLGLALAAVQLGAAFGAIIAGPVADKLGRKNVVIIFGIICFASVVLTGFTNSPDLMMVVRFITGIGLGGSSANCIPLFAEYCPPKRRAFLTTLLTCGLPFGMGVAGVVGARIVSSVADPHMGWRMFFWLMGGIPLLATIAFFWFMPESVRYMIYKGVPSDKIRATLSNIAPISPDVTSFESGEKAVTADEKKAGMALVMSKRFLPGTIMLWLTYFCGLIIVYSVGTWLPSLLTKAEFFPGGHAMSSPMAMVVTSLFSFGALAAILMGALMDRRNPNLVLAISYGVAVVAIFAIGHSFGMVIVLAVLVFLGGTFIMSAQSSVAALAALFYPAEGRATGVSWMIGVGKFGGFVGIMLVDALLAASLGIAGILTVVAVVGLICVVALLVKNAIYPPARQVADEAQAELIGVA
ncbi:MAG: MFS transporter [Propionibacteriaceae bacterium]|nr:MFS transporter [Propionibacteriaceae bacterium]